MNNTSLEVDMHGAEVRIDFNNTKGNNDLILTNEEGQKHRYHLSHMVWKYRSEHMIDKKFYAAELQVYHVQFATNRQVALSFLFDQDLSIGVEPERLKTCFVDSF